ncbi:MAG TPA: hypothetical protein VGL40_11840 [Bacillota bacterium]
MAFTKVLINWVKQYGDATELFKWITPSKFGPGQESSLRDVGRQVLDDFVKKHAGFVAEVIAVHPEFASWYNSTGTSIIEECTDQIVVDREEELVDLIGLVEYMSYLMEGATSVDDRWFWLIEALEQLHSGLKKTGLLRSKYLVLEHIQNLAAVNVSISFDLKPALHQPTFCFYGGHPSTRAADAMETRTWANVA